MDYRFPGIETATVPHFLNAAVEWQNLPFAATFINLTNISLKSAQLVGYGACLVLGLVLLVVCRFHFGSSPECEVLEVDMVCTLVPLCSPLALTYFFCWLLPAWTAITFGWNHPSLAPETLRIVNFSSIATGILLASAITEQFDPTLQAYGMTSWGSVALFLTLAFIRFHSDKVARRVP